MNKRCWMAGMFLLAAPLLLLSACGSAGPSTKSYATPTAKSYATPTAAAPFDPHIVTYSAIVRVQVGKPASVSAYCQAGQQMIGGGFAASNLFEYAASIEASYPSDANTWTVTATAPASYFDLAAEVYCVSVPVSLGVQIIQGGSASGGLVGCPEGTQLLSGGFQGSDPVAASYPVENGWSTGLNDQVYALCARQHVTAGWVVSTVFHAHSSATGYQPSGGNVGCSGGQFAAGGGFSSQGAVILSNIGGGGGSPLSGWSVSAGGDADVTVYALCVTLRG